MHECSSLLFITLSATTSLSRAAHFAESSCTTTGAYTHVPYSTYDMRTLSLVFCVGIVVG